MSNAIPIPTKPLLVLLTIFLIIFVGFSSDWKSSLIVYLSGFLLLNIFFDVVPLNESFTPPINNETIFNGKNSKVVNCQQYKDVAIHNMNEYIKCKNTIGPKVVCPKQLVNTKSIENKAVVDGSQIQSEKYYADKQPISDRVCGLIPGHELKHNKESIGNSSVELLSDDELKKAINIDIKLHKILSELKDNLVQDPLNHELHNKLENVQSVIKQVKPLLIYNLRTQNKDENFIKNAISS